MGRYFDEPCDLDIREDGSIGYVDGVELYRQRLETAFGTGLGSWRYDLRKGFPWRAVFDAGADMSRVQAIVTEWLGGLPGIVSVESVEAEMQPDRHVRITWAAITTDGLATGAGTV